LHFALGEAEPRLELEPGAGRQRERRLAERRQRHRLVRTLDGFHARQHCRAAHQRTPCLHRIPPLVGYEAAVPDRVGPAVPGRAGGGGRPAGERAAPRRPAGAAGGWGPGRIPAPPGFAAPPPGPPPPAPKPPRWWDRGGRPQPAPPPPYQAERPKAPENPAAK